MKKTISKNPTNSGEEASGVTQWRASGEGAANAKHWVWRMPELLDWLETAKNNKNWRENKEGRRRGK